MAAAQPHDMRHRPGPERGNVNEDHEVIGRRRRAADGGLPRQLLDAGRTFMLLGVLILTWHHLASYNVEHTVAAFLLWLLGTALAMLAIVARQFPRLAAAGAALAKALCNYLLGGL